MRLEIISPKGYEFRGEALSLNTKTQAGEITILNHHRPLISLLTKGEAHVLDTSEKQFTITVHSGFLEVSSDNSVTMLIN